MRHLPDLISDLPLIVIAGAITTISLGRIKQPLVLDWCNIIWSVGVRSEIQKLKKATVSGHRDGETLVARRGIKKHNHNQNRL